MLLAGQGHVAHDVQAVPAAHGPSWHHGDHHLVHEADLALDVQDVESVDPVLAFVAGVGPDILIATAAERPAPVLGRRAFSCDENDADVLALVASDQRLPKLIHGLGRECIPYFGAVERDARHPFVDFERDFLVVLDRFPGEL